MKVLKYTAAAVFVAAVALISGCSHETVEIKIKDNLVSSVFSVESGKTVSEILSEAEIGLGEKDEVKPALTEVITSSSDIVITRNSTVTVEADGKIKKLSVLGGRVSDAVRKAGVKLGDNDVVSPDADSFLTDGERITVTRRYAVRLFSDGKKKKYVTTAESVGSFLEERGIKLGKRDSVKPSEKTAVKDGMKITVTRVSQKTVTEKVVIKYSTDYIDDPDMDLGTAAVSVEGRNGLKKVTYRLTVTDGKVTGRRKLSEKIVKEPVNEVIRQGTRPPATEAPTDANGKREVSRQRVDDCDGSGHGYFVIKYSDGSVDYEEY